MNKIEAGKAVRKIVEDLRGRGGFDHVWDSLDDGVRNEIRNAWIKILLGDK